MTEDVLQHHDEGIEGGVRPTSGTILAPGLHLLELEFARPVPEAVLRQALGRMGFEDVMLDVAVGVARVSTPAISPEILVPDLWRSWREWGTVDGRAASDDATIRYRFVARLTQALQTFDTPHMRWLFDHVLPLDVGEDSIGPHARATGCELARGQLYAFRFLMRMLSQPTREAVCEALAVMGFRPHKIIMLKRNMRVPGLPNASVGRWYGLGRWECADSVLTGEDPLIFEELTVIS